MNNSCRQAVYAAAWLLLASCGGGQGPSTPPDTPQVPVAGTPLPGQRAVGSDCVGVDGTGWCWRTPQPAPRQFVDIDFVDRQHGWAVGEAGAVYATADGGASWTPRPIPFPQELRLVKFADARRGWVLTSLSRELFATEDGGQTWRNLGEPPAEVPYYGWGLNHTRSLELVGENTLVATGISRGEDRISEDGGSTWRASAVDNVAGVSPRGTLWSRFPRGLVVSHDLGRTATTAIECSYTCVVDADFSDHDRPAALVVESANGLPTDHYILYRSSDAGLSWTARDVTHPPVTPGDTLAIPRVFGQNLWASSARGQLETVALSVPPGGSTSLPKLTAVWTSGDGGQTWSARTLPSPRSNLWNLQPLDATTAWLGGSQAFLTTDGAASWKEIAVPGENPAMLYELRLRRGVLLASFLGNPMRRWYSSNDGGTTWNPLPGAQAGSAPFFQALRFSDSMHGVAVTSDGVRETNDGGRTWQGFSDVVAAGQMAFSGTYFGPNGSVWIATTTQLLSTRDAGRTWRVADTGSAIPSTIGPLYFADDTTGWLTACMASAPQGCVSRQLYETTDGGGTWHPAPGSSAASGPGAILLANPRVYFRTPKEAWVPPSRGIDKPMRTTDGGRTWTPVPIPNTGAQVTAIHFADARNGWMVGEHGLMLRTADGGSTWEIQESGTERTLTSVFALDANTVYAGGWNGAVLFTRTGGRY